MSGDDDLPMDGELDPNEPDGPESDEPDGPEEEDDPLEAMENAELAVRLVSSLLHEALEGEDAPTPQDKVQVEVRYHGGDRVAKGFERDVDDLDDFAEEIVEWAADDVLSSKRTDTIRYTASVVGSNESRNFSLRRRRDVHDPRDRDPDRGRYAGPGPGRYAGPPPPRGASHAMSRRDGYAPRVHEGHFDDDMRGFRAVSPGERLVETLTDAMIDMHRLLSAQAERDARTIDSLMDRNAALMAEHERTFRMREQLEQRTFERELAAREAEAEQDRADRIEGHLTMWAPSLINGLLAKLGMSQRLQEPLTPLEMEMIGWSMNLTPEKIAKIQSVFDPGEQAKIFQMAKLAREREAAIRAAQATQQQHNQNGGATPGFAGAPPHDGGGSSHGN